MPDDDPRITFEPEMVLGEANLTEPLIVPDLIVNGIVVSSTAYITRFVGWVLTPVGDAADERRIVLRFVMPNDAARKFAREMAKTLPSGN